ncbi:ComEC/Rec2 family competence protein [Candidatus Methanomassiliicoccus intestinalis]
MSKSTKKSAVAIVIMILLLCILIYPYLSDMEEGGASGGGISGNGFISTADQSHKIDDKTVEITLGELKPIPKVTDATIVLYNPENDVKYSESFEGSEYKITFEDITVTFDDTNGDGLMDAEEKLVFENDDAFGAGIWNIEVNYDGYSNGTNTYRFHIFENNVEEYTENVRINFLDVGQADSALIFTSDNKTIMIDAGIPLNKTSYIPKLLDQLEKLGVEKIDALILTHPDYDHIAGAAAVLEKYEVGSFYTCKKDSPSATYSKLVEAVNNEKCETHYGDFSAGDYLNLSTTESFRVLAVDALNTDANSASVVIRMSCASSSIMFTGDAPSEVEQIIIKDFTRDADVDVLKVGHHGSRTASSEEFLKIATPEISVISCGAGNSYGHPHAEALERLEKYSTEIIRIDEVGKYTYVSEGGTIAGLSAAS